MSEPVYHTQGAWEAQENEKFQSIVDKLGSIGNAQIAYLVVALVLLPFMGNYFTSESEYPTNAMNNISNVDLYDMQEITSSYDQFYEGVVEGKPVYSDEDYMQMVMHAYSAANNLLVDVYTNPVFANTPIPSEVLGNLETVLAYDPSNVEHINVTYVVDGQTKTTSVPQFNVDYRVTTRNAWAGAIDPSTKEPRQPGDPLLQEWSAEMQKIQSALQNATTLFTDESSTEQSTVNFYNSQSKIFFGSMKGDIKDIVSQQQTDVQNEIPRG